MSNSCPDYYFETATWIYAWSRGALRELGMPAVDTRTAQRRAETYAKRAGMKRGGDRGFWGGPALTWLKDEAREHLSTACMHSLEDHVDVLLGNALGVGVGVGGALASFVRG